MQQSGRFSARRGFVVLLEAQDETAVCDRCSLPLFGRLLTAAFIRGDSLYFWCQKYIKPVSSPRSVAAFWSSKSGVKTDPPTKKPERRLFCQAGIIRRRWRRERSAFSFGAEKERLTARAPGAGGCKGSILLRPLSTGRKTIPQRTTCGWFWYF